MGLGEGRAQSHRSIIAIVPARARARPQLACVLSFSVVLVSLPCGVQHICGAVGLFKELSKY